MNHSRKELQMELTTAVNISITSPYYKFMFKDQNPQLLRLELLGTVTTKDAPRKGPFTSQCIQSSSICCWGGEKTCGFRLAAIPVVI